MRSHCYGVPIQRKRTIAQVGELGGIELAPHQSTARVRVGAQEEMTDFMGKSAPERHAETAFFERDAVISHIATGPRDQALGVFAEQSFDIEERQRPGVRTSRHAGPGRTQRGP